MITDRAEAGLLTRVTNILLLLIALVVLLVCCEQGKSAIHARFDGQREPTANKGDKSTVARYSAVKRLIERPSDGSTSAVPRGGSGRSEGALLSAVPSRLVPSKRGVQRARLSEISLKLRRRGVELSN